MHLGKGQDDFANKLALGRGQFQKGIEGFAFEAADAFVSALFVQLDRITDGLAKAQHLRFNFEAVSQYLQLLL
ncbi:MAG: hypothetical protein U1D27_10190 [Rhodoferax sp.]|nr:hypothetical protein [Rhodoferax sp.]MDZ4208093.1 hypothetical protein [Rhodoferax sp.]